MSFEKAIENSVNYLETDAAVKSLEADAYWPKWDSPWWHMLLLYEMGEAHQIPMGIAQKYVEAINRIPLKIFPIHPEDMPPGTDPFRGSPCHCQLGHVYKVLSEVGVDVDQELPWMRPWFLKYQMADGGLNCDNDAYLVKDEVPSSMVGTIPIFEAVLLYTPRGWNEAEKKFLDLGAKFLIDRQLTKGSDTKHNSSERISAKEDWFKLCFPRFYPYDILRGLHTLLQWSEKTGGRVPPEAIRDVVVNIQERFPDGQLKAERFSYEFANTLIQNEAGEWKRREGTTMFPLLEATSRLGVVSKFLSRDWQECHRIISQNAELKHLLG